MALVPFTLSDLDIRLLKGLPTINTLKGTNCQENSQFLNDLIDNLDKEADDQLLILVYKLFDVISDDKASLLDDLNIHETNRPQFFLLLAAKLIKLFVQLNSTGPEVEFKRDSSGSISLTTKVVFEELDLKSKLELDGYEISEHAVMPQLLVIAEEFLRLNSHKPEIWIAKLHGWWCIRAYFLHQQILDGRSLTLAGCMSSVAQAIQTQFVNYEEDLDLKALWYSEMCDVHLYYYDIVSAKSCLAEAGKSCGAEFYTTGVLGKKTKFQTKDLPQLVVKANVEHSTERPDNLSYLEEFNNSRSVVNLPLNDDTRLEKVQVKEGEDVKFHFTTVQQVVLLAELNYLKKSQPKGELLKEGILAHVQGLLEDPKLWSVLVVALLNRSMVETDHGRTVERSMMQFENIQKAVTDKCPSFNTRYQFYHSTPMPLKWEIDVALGDVLLSLGQVKNALDIYLRLNMWESVIVCYHMLELKHKAEEVIREQIVKTGETPKLLVYLGDATNDISYYEKAWVLSESRNFLSRQRLGVYWFKKQEYEKAIPYLQQAVELNPLEYPVWVRLGYAALHTEQWALSAKAYVHANSLDDDSFENWNNLSKATLKMGNTDQALRALKQATKCNYEEWKVWENLMLVALQCSDLEWTMMAFNRLIDLKGNYCDEMVLRLLVDLVCDDAWDKKGDSSHSSKDQLQKLLGRVTATVSTHPDVWQCYATFLYKTLPKDKAISQDGIEEQWHKLIVNQQKSIRCRIQNKNWDKVPEITQTTVESIHHLCAYTRQFMNDFPRNPGVKDLEIQAQFLLKQVRNSINGKLKEVPDPTVYARFLSSIQESAAVLAD